MKRLYSIIVLIFTSNLLFAQGGTANLPASKAGNAMTISPSANQNYILTTTYLAPGGSNSTVGAAIPEVQYFDGLGRPVEKVEINSSQNGYDVVSMQTYDAFGNPEKAYLPYSKYNNNGAFVSGSSFISEQSSFLSGLYGSTDGAKGYAITEYEKSPLNRAIKQGAPGNDWQLTRPVKTNYKTNTSSDQVTGWTANIYGSFGGGYNFPDGRLYLTETIDEDNKVTREYTDLQGRVVQTEVDGLKTRYCYDLFGRLASVMMPSATEPASGYRDTYQYKYDQRGRMTDKKLPVIGSMYDFIFYIYDSRDRLVLTQDPHQRNPSIRQWSYVIYDGFNRPVEEGTWTSTTDRETLASNVDSNIDYMSNQASRTALKKSYYSDYSNTPSANTLNTSDASALGVVQATNNNGRLTGEYVKMLDRESDMPEWLFIAYYYDKYGRLIQTVADNHLGGKDVITNKYNFVGQVIQTRTRHTVGAVTRVLNRYFDYDHRGRLMKTRQQVDQDAEVLIAANSYNEAGNLTSKYLHSVSGGNFLQKTDYTYNIRNWLAAINDPVTFNENDKFGMQLQYNTVTSPGTAQYNGNIAAMIWGTPANPNLRYDFSYDNKNRLINSVFSNTAYPTGSYNENMSYDVNGNIVNLNRTNYGTFAIDNLVMNYTGCMLASVKDNCLYFQQNWVPNYYNNNLLWGFGYHLDGNLTQDDSRSLNIDYNVKSLPRTFTYTKTMGKVSNFYTFNGEKLRKNYESSGTVTKLDYCGPFVYNTASGIRSLAYIITPEGRAVANGSSWDYEYNLTDHLGNVRTVIKPGTNGVATVVQEKHYYPTGLEIGYLGSSSSTNKYLYNGKELYDEFQMYWYDYGARYYDAALCRWNTVDPHAEKYLNLTPYNYVANNPMLLVDPNGMDWFYYSKDGKSDPTWNWRDEHQYHTGVKDSNGKEIVLQGTEAVVVFEGSVDERFGTKEKGDKGFDGRHKYGYLDGHDAKNAKVTVYGSDGADDIKTYTGYTMSSDPGKYGIVADGIYNANFDEIGKGGILKSNWTLNSRGKIPTYWDNPYSPYQKDNNGNSYLTGIFIHQSNSTGWAGGGVSKGCLLISPNDWKNFNNHLDGVKNFKVQVTRTWHTPFLKPQTN